MAEPRKKKTIHDYYKVQKELGKGTFAIVNLATRVADDQDVAIKVIDKRKCKDTAALRNEVSCLKACQHRNIIRLHELFESKSKVYLVMELVKGGELFDRIVKLGKYSEADARGLFYNLADAIGYLHERSIVHRDLKPENLLVAEESNVDVKLADFGLSIVVDDGETLFTCAGTPGYVAPEVLAHHGYGKEVDIWALGVILYILLVGFPPFYDQDMSALFKKIMRGDYSMPSPHWDCISDDAKDLIKKILVVNPKDRLDIAGIMNHPWLSEELPSLHLESTLSELKKYNARRKFRAGVMAVMAANRFKVALESIKDDVEKFKTGLGI
ncbi:Protein kinase domain [Carpediemonas membranifera]|uniref:Protein kinase domain n=1 Tax=Carpediemonas membranifera TaxID=201153 RepID=A0A8J6E3M9_9EUKA|nr:Protein kinase domain [Carpediemonas membranifera]|eukprot:KAG9396143.1 Protein kinase domain [Carpediemonas membranifera]